MIGRCVQWRPYWRVQDDEFEVAVRLVEDAADGLGEELLAL